MVYGPVAIHTQKNSHTEKGATVLKPEWPRKPQRACVVSVLLILLFLDHWAPIPMLSLGSRVLGELPGDLATQWMLPA